MSSILSFSLSFSFCLSECKQSPCCCLFSTGLMSSYSDFSSSLSFSLYLYLSSLHCFTPSFYPLFASSITQFLQCCFFCNLRFYFEILFVFLSLSLYVLLIERLLQLCSVCPLLVINPNLFSSSKISTFSMGKSFQRDFGHRVLLSFTVALIELKT